MNLKNKLVALILIATLLVALPTMVLSGCTQTTEANDSSEAVALDDAHTLAAEELPIMREQLELKEAELEQKEVELESAQGMLAGLQASTDADEELMTTYTNLVEQINADIEELNKDIAYLKDYIKGLEKQLGESSDEPTGAAEDDPLLGENAPEDLQDIESIDEEIGIDP